MADLFSKISQKLARARPPLLEPLMLERRWPKPAPCAPRSAICRPWICFAI